MLIHSRRKPSEIARIFSMMYKNKIPENSRDPIYLYSRIDFRGTSFLVNPQSLWEDMIHQHPRDVSIYLWAASFRLYPEYKLSGILDLDANLCPIKDLSNRMFNDDLIQNVDGRLKFLYEEQFGEL